MKLLGVSLIPRWRLGLPRWAGSPVRYALDNEGPSMEVDAARLPPGTNIGTAFDLEGITWRVIAGADRHVKVPLLPLFRRRRVWVCRVAEDWPPT